MSRPRVGSDEKMVSSRLVYGCWLGLSTGWATVAIDRPQAALGAPHAPCITYGMQGGKGVNESLPLSTVRPHARNDHTNQRAPQGAGVPRAVAGAKLA